MAQFGAVMRMFPGLELWDGRDDEREEELRVYGLELWDGREEELRVWVGLPGVVVGDLVCLGACLGLWCIVSL